MPRTRPPYPVAFRQQILEFAHAGRTPTELSLQGLPHLCKQYLSLGGSRSGIRSSMSPKDNGWDNAPTESFFGHLKVACALGHKFSTQVRARVTSLDWIALYNHTRLHTSLDYLHPMQYDPRWIAAQRKEAAGKPGLWSLGFTGNLTLLLVGVIFYFIGTSLLKEEV